MKILIVSSTFGTYGGIEAFVLRLADYLQHEAGREVRICFRQLDGSVVEPTFLDLCEKSGLPISFVPKGGMDLWRAIGWADLVHGQNTSPDTVLFSRLRGKPVVLTIHNWRMHTRGVGPFFWWLAARLASARWYNSNFVWKTWERGRPWKGSARVPTVSNLPSGAIPTQERKGFIFVGRWIENKGLEILIAAYAAARLDRDAWPLTLIGDGPLRERVVGLLRQYGLERVGMPGFVDEVCKAEEIRRAKWMVVPPHTNEDMGLTPLEARSVGVPCIVTRDGGLPEAAGEYALVCEPKDVQGLRDLLERAARMSETEYEERARLSEAGLQEFLKPMSFYCEQYDRLVGEKIGESQ